MLHLQEVLHRCRRTRREGDPVPLLRPPSRRTARCLPLLLVHPLLRLLCLPLLLVRSLLRLLRLLLLLLMPPPALALPAPSAMAPARPAVMAALRRSRRPAMFAPAPGLTWQMPLAPMAPRQLPLEPMAARPRTARAGDRLAGTEVKAAVRYAAKAARSDPLLDLAMTRARRRAAARTRSRIRHKYAKRKLLPARTLAHRASPTALLVPQGSRRGTRSLGYLRDNGVATGTLPRVPTGAQPTYSTAMIGAVLRSNNSAIGIPRKRTAVAGPAGSGDATAGGMTGLPIGSSTLTLASHSRREHL